MRKHSRRGERGMALILALFFVAVAVALLGSMTLRLVNQRNQVGHYEDYTQCFNGLEAAYARTLVRLEKGETAAVGLGTWSPNYAAFVPPDFEGSGLAPAILPGVTDVVEFVGFAQDWATDGVDNIGNGLVDDPSEEWSYTIHAFARSGLHTRRTETVVRATDVNVWRNAIFAGAGQAGGLINGNVSIHGSVHLLGQNIAEGNQAIAAIDLSGTSLIHNNYVGLTADLQARIPALPTVNWNGEDVQTLDANLRVKRGLVGMSGNSEVGSPDVPGNDVKETMDGTYVNDGWTGNAVVDDGGRGDPKSVFSDNGWDELYDLGDRVSFPTLNDDWREPVTGDRQWNPATNAWYSHEAYFSEVLVGAADDPNDGIHVGNVTLNPAAKSNNPGHFYHNATTGETLKGSLPATMPGPDESYILFNSDTDVLRINGQVRINGDLTMRGQGNQTTIHYTGRGALLVDGNATLDVNLLACNNGNPANTSLSFPVNNCFGIMATQDMVVGSVAQITLMGAFYAQGKIVSAKQTTVLGTFVSNYFDMGTNVPDIYQVPTLADNLPYGMIGNYPILSFSRISWREIGVSL